MSETFLVLGATGKTGRRVADRLREAGKTVRSASRSGETRFDWQDESTWAAALAGVHAVYLVAPTVPSQAWQVVPPFVRQAVAAGVRRLVLLSARGIDAAGDDKFLTSEHAVQGSGLEWTILRPTWFAQNFSEAFFLPQILEGVLAVPTGEGKEPFIDVEDIADVAVAALTQDHHAGKIYELSGPEALTFGEAAAKIAAVLGREIRFVDLDGEAFLKGSIEAGVPEEHAGVLLGLFTAIRNGFDGHLSTGVRDALGREPRSFDAYVRTAAGSGAWAGQAR
ncbi:NAD(P)H-binding protein [Streptomyces hesseae]|uniref:NAD(P)H-binding protein n=1 Tax=Streptomyces hesseae TaxID=3075519 RepID=A0ABU2SHC7_9ACTN|nr:NAD(P)H-binding protein [Streptomyces sp. DSM 40473]MDT0448188.1 NAD(P)H-binding protein [Streptomyces sp. DSM 40473]